MIIRNVLSVWKKRYEK